ncbi:uncharacterized protein TNCV_4365531 [Trichonephila clavipes]|nr:uncharacterized protein TNCV_4365531 [Trichonephila clavipes]
MLHRCSIGLRSVFWSVDLIVVRASDSRPEGLGSMLDVTKYPPSAHGFTCRNCGGGDRGRVAIYRPFEEVSLSLNRTVTCMVLKANDRRTSCPCHDEFRGPRSDYVRQVALATTQQQQQLIASCTTAKALNCEGSILGHCLSKTDESRSFFRVHTGYFSNIPKCIKAEFIARWACSQSSVVSSSKR